MTNVFEPGHVLQSLQGKEIRIETLLAREDRDGVYSIVHDGEKKLLRWYGAGREPEELDRLREQLREKMDRGNPGKAFFWPEDLTDLTEEGFGYVTDPEPEKTVTFQELREGKFSFSGWSERLRASIRLVEAFSGLHRLGFCFRDFSGELVFSPDGNALRFPETGELVPIDGKQAAESPSPYHAPEVREGGNPGLETDRYAMAAWLFFLLCQGHPLEGRRLQVPLLTEEEERAVYGLDPVFVFDPERQENRPHPLLQPGVEERWNRLPAYTQNLFCRAFGQDAMKAPELRPGETEWLKCLCRMKNDRIGCECGNVLFAANRKICTCNRCGKPVKVTARLVLPEYAMPAEKGLSIHRCQLGDCPESRLPEKVALVELTRSGEPVLKNISGMDWDARTPSGARKTVRHEETVPVRDGIVLYIDGMELRMERE